MESSACYTFMRCCKNKQNKERVLIIIKALTLDHKTDE
jgi:hypothetical protein